MNKCHKNSLERSYTTTMILLLMLMALMLIPTMMMMIVIVMLTRMKMTKMLFQKGLFTEKTWENVRRLTLMLTFMCYLKQEDGREGWLTASHPLKDYICKNLLLHNTLKRRCIYLLRRVVKKKC